MAQNPPDDSNAEDDDAEAMEPFETDTLADPEGRVLSPGELDFSERDEVSDLGEGRYIVSAGADSDPSGAVGSGGGGSLPLGGNSETPPVENRGVHAGGDTGGTDGSARTGRDLAPDEGDAQTSRPGATASTTEPRENADSTPPRSRNPGSEPSREAVDAEAVADWLTDSMTGNGFDYGFDATLKHDGEVTRHRMDSTEGGATFETLLLWYAKQVDDERPVEETLGHQLADSDVSITFPPEAILTMLSHHGMSRDDTIADLLNAVKQEGGVRFSTR